MYALCNSGKMLVAVVESYFLFLLCSFATLFCTLQNLSKEAKAIHKNASILMI